MNDIALNSSIAAAARLIQEARLGEAESALRQLLLEHPENAYVLQLLGIVSMKRDRRGEAEDFFRRAIAMKSDYFEAYNNLGIVMREEARYEESIAAYGEALKLRPDNADVLNNLGNALQLAGEGKKAAEVFKRALQLRPGHAEYLHNLGLALQLQGYAAEAAEIFGQISRMVGEPVFHTNRVFTLHFDPKADAASIFAEHLDWDRRFGQPLRDQIRSHDNERDPERRLRIGYVSGDFRRHSVAFFIEPLLANHHPEEVEVFCYSNSGKTDDITERLRRSAHHWRDIFEMEDGATAELIRKDRIDILVELAGHTEGGRLLVFARKPAPVQAAYLGYPDTTGLSTIDYRLTDGYLDPPGAERFYSEKLIRLPRTFACYRPADDAMEVSASPAGANGYPVFASFNNFSKINPEWLDCWGEIVAKVPGSRFMMVAHGIQSADTRGRIGGIFYNRGVTPDRLMLLARQPWEAYFALHHGADIMLDTFPVCGHTVTCHALWMGLPVVTLAGQTCCQRLGASVLSNLNLESLIARNREEYVRIATELAGDFPRLAKLRGELRQRMRESPIMDGAGLAREVEGAYRGMWQRYCDQRKVSERGK